MLRGVDVPLTQEVVTEDCEAYARVIEEGGTLTPPPGMVRGEGGRERGGMRGEAGSRAP